MADGVGRQDTDREYDQENTMIVHEAVAPAWAAPHAAAMSVSQAVYSRRAVLAAAYKLSDRCAVLVDTDKADRWLLYVVAQREADAKPLLVNLIQELNDQALRDRLEEEFGDVRTLIVAQAFSEGNLLDDGRDNADP